MSEPRPPNSVTLDRRDDAIVIRIAAKLLEDKDVKELGRLIDGSPGSPVVVDLSQVRLVPSLSLGALVQLASKCRSRQQRLTLAALSPAVRQVFLITRLDRVLELSESVDAALS